MFAADGQTAEGAGESVDVSVSDGELGERYSRLQHSECDGCGVGVDGNAARIRAGRLNVRKLKGCGDEAPPRTLPDVLFQVTQPLEWDMQTCRTVCWTVNSRTAIRHSYTHHEIDSFGTLVRPRCLRPVSIL